MTAKRTNAKSAEKRAREKAVKSFELIVKKKSRELYAEHRHESKLRYDAFRPQIEHAQSINKSNRAAVQAFEKHLDRVAARRRRIFADPRPPEFPGHEWMLSHVDVPYLRPPFHPGSLKFKTLRILKIAPIETTRYELTPILSGDGSVPPAAAGGWPPEFEIRGFYKVRNTGSVFASQSIGTTFDASDSGDTVLDVKSAIRGTLLAGSAAGKADAKFSVESALFEESGALVVASNHDAYLTYSKTLAFDDTVGVFNDLDLSLWFKRTAGTRYWLWHYHTFYLEGKDARIEVSFEGHFARYTAYLYT